MSTPSGSQETGNLKKLDKLLAGLELNDATEAIAQIARTIASKLDSSLADDSPQSSSAVAALSKELRSTIDQILSAQEDKSQFLAGIFSGD